MNRNRVIIAIIITLIAFRLYVGFRPQSPGEPETLGTLDAPQEPEELETPDEPEEPEVPEAPPVEPVTPPPVEEPTYEVIDLYTIIVDTDGPRAPGGEGYMRLCYAANLPEDTKNGVNRFLGAVNEIAQKNRLT